MKRAGSGVVGGFLFVFFPVHVCINVFRFCVKQSNDITDISLYGTGRENSRLAVLWIKQSFFFLFLNVFMPSKCWPPSYLTIMMVLWKPLWMIRDRCTKSTGRQSSWSHARWFRWTESLSLENFNLQGKRITGLKSLCLTQNFIMNFF